MPARRESTMGERTGRALAYEIPLPKHPPRMQHVYTEARNAELVKRLEARRFDVSPFPLVL